eukprot:CAMPEP_0113907416 /NCGR_PEP_ID=MMETSP0780_2-20120614/25469_1 /TAXON_ID=652834 /ORGANISM="Palpitomonas bilix" /LENGTH=359 /DNA_ID=CAMNT_0000902481 /DNA_START=192 /DNA_END=1267 /DNA_ORIENTATION=- /assembly_acc=CAM_ASM_000599
MAEQDVPIVDGSYLEGGGQIVRQSLAVAAILKRNVRIEKVRAGRPNPGLQRQHLAGAKAVAELCGGRLDGAELKSTTVMLTPAVDPLPTSTSYTYEVDGAGSTMLILQAILPVLFFPSEEKGVNEVVVTLGGGTNASFAPFSDYIELLLLPLLSRLCHLHASLEVVKRGFFPRGGGEVKVSVMKADKSWSGFKLEERGEVTSITLWVAAAGAKQEEVQEMEAAALALLKRDASVRKAVTKAKIARADTRRAPSKGSALLIVAETSTGCLLAGDALSGKEKQSGKQLGEAAAKSLLAQLRHGGCVDEHMQDQLLVYGALASSPSHILTGPLTDHTRTGIAVLTQLIPSLKVEVEKKGGTT